MSFVTTNPDEFNAMFGEALRQGGEKLDKVAEVTGLYIQEKLRENSFARQILPPQTVTVAELTRNEDDEGLRYIDDLEPGSVAMQINMRGEPTKTYIEAPRYSIKMQLISSDRFQKSEQELRSYRIPLTKVIEQNTVKDIQEVQDQRFMEHVRAGLMFATRHRMNELSEAGVITNTVDATGTAAATAGQINFFNADALASYLFTRVVGDAADLGALSGATPGVYVPASANTNENRAAGFHSNIIMSDEPTFVRQVVTQGAQIAAAREMKARVFLIHEYNWAETASWTQDDAGLELLKEIVVGGYKYTTVGGYTFVTTVRGNADIMEPGQIYCFPAPEFLGRFLVLEQVQFYINKEGRFFSMEAWEECGVGFGNIRGLGLVLLAGAGVTLPNLFIGTDGAVQASSGTFRLVNDIDAPLP